jgi:hypothetical protein
MGTMTKSSCLVPFVILILSLRHQYELTCEVKGCVICNVSFLGDWLEEEHFENTAVFLSWLFHDAFGIETVQYR